MSIVSTFRNFVSRLPSWLKDGDDEADPAKVSDGAKVHRTLFTLADAASERARQGLYARFPSYAPETALALIGEDRGLIRGRSESRTSYGKRLLKWRAPRGHRVRGSAFALLEQISIYFERMRAFTLDVKGNYHERTETPGGTVTETFTYGNAWNWDGAGAAPAWARFWVFVDTRTTNAIGPQPDFGDPDLWGGELGTEGYSLGVRGLSSRDFDLAFKIVRGTNRYPAWKPGGTRAEWLILIFDGEPISEVSPDGTWLHWSKDNGSGTRVATRYDGWRYISLTPNRNNAYAGDPEDLSESTTMPDDSIYTGDPDLADFGPVTMPNGTLYTGNADLADFGPLPLYDDGVFPS